MDNINFRSALPVENTVFGSPASLPVGSAPPPPLPPRIQFNNPAQPPYGSSPAMNYYGYGGGGYGGAGFGGYGGGLGSFGSGMFNSYGSYGSYGAGMFGQQRYGGAGGGDVESRFIQMAEENSRPAFQSIESFVSVIGNFATMLDSTFFALNSSFRAILGVTANLGKLRNMFGQFLSSIALFRGLHWLWRKVLYTLHLSRSDPSTSLFKEAFNAAAASSPQNALGGVAGAQRVSAWPMVAFLSFIFAAPYLIMRLVGKPDTAKLEQARDPRTWSQPIASQALHSFHANGAQELSLVAGELVYVAPKEVQNTLGLMNTGWAMATKDCATCGMVPINYLQRKQQGHIPRAAQPVPQPPPMSHEAMNRVFESRAPSPVANVGSAEASPTTTATTTTAAEDN